jgi:hypothetical protein
LPFRTHAAFEVGEAGRKLIDGILLSCSPLISVRPVRRSIL